MPAKPLYSRILLKVSGEALMGEGAFGIDRQVIENIAGEIRAASDLGVRVAIVVGGGNIFRGLALAGEGADRVTGDQMGMLATVLNALALRMALAELGLDAVVLSAIQLPQICEPFSQRALEAHSRADRIVIFAGGTGNPFFTTDTAAALRAAEFGAEALFKATQVDGIYSADPKTEPDAERFDQITYDEVLERGLKVMDAAAIALARDNAMPVVVFSIHEPGGLVEILQGRGRCTTVRD